MWVWDYCSYFDIIYLSATRTLIWWKTGAPLNQRKSHVSDKLQKGSWRVQPPYRWVVQQIRIPYLTTLWKINWILSLAKNGKSIHSFHSYLREEKKSKTEHCSLLNTVHLWLEYKKREIRDLDLEENSPGFLLWLHIRKRGFYISDSIVSLVVYRVKSRVITPIQKPEHFISSLMLSFFPAEQLLLHCNL